MAFRLLLAFFICSIATFGQERPLIKEIDTTRTKVTPEQEVTIKDYKIVSYQRDTTHLDTTLTIQKEYKYNYLRKDDFELLPFSNVGQPYNKLAYNIQEKNFYPQLGAKAKHYSYMQKEDINYYNVPTPTTELFFKTVFEQGQLADGLITLNTSRRFNFSIANKGLRSLGKYQHIRSSIGNFRMTANYVTRNNRYALRVHFVSQDATNQENGGIINKEQFESGEDEFTDRSRIDVAFQDAENLLVGKRYFLDHIYTIKQKKDSLSSSELKIAHEINYETKFYRYDQTRANDIFGEAFQARNILDRAQLKAMYNQLNLQYTNNTLGRITTKVAAYNYNYFFRSILFTDDGVITNQLKGDEFAVGGTWLKKIDKLTLKADAMTTLSGDLGGTAIDATLSYQLDNENKITATIFSNSRMPNFNMLLYQSNYKDYNWQNTENFIKEEDRGISLVFNSKKWVNIEASYTQMDNYTYFASVTQELGDTIPEIIPFQNTEPINYLKVKLNKEFKIGKFALNNTVMYQAVNQEQEIFNVPELVTRNTLYFSDHLFNKAMFLQAGVTFKYFSEYYMDGYNPLLSEFYSQNQEKLGGFPLIDLFINAKVRQTRIYLKAEHLNSPFTEPNFYSAPNHPYRDFTIRFGLIWNFFI
ncbi:putative porin [Leptobacterium sp. I13]|uniref:putative porin n=1 Tax=Leptobacterium meishanense TaxID=3128904 RepID=UPI0030ED589B